MSTSSEAKKPALVINARNKEKYVERAVNGALSQTIPCEIILSDQHSDDATFRVMEQTVENYLAQRGEYEGYPPFHEVRLLHCPVEGKYGMRACNEHFDWILDQTDAEWVFQCSADDYSLPRRVEVCVDAIRKNPCVMCANTMYFCEPGVAPNPAGNAVSGYPTKTGYIGAAEGLMKLAYGSTIWAVNREWVKKMGSAGDGTADVFYGFLASLKEGFYAIAEPLHVHTLSADLGNMGFQGKMRAAEASGDKETITRINELNRFQLLDLYMSIAMRAQEKYPLCLDQDKTALFNMMFSQAAGWLEERKRLHAMGITPGVM